MTARIEPLEPTAKPDVTPTAGQAKTGVLIGTKKA